MICFSCAALLMPVPTRKNPLELAKSPRVAYECGTPSAAQIVHEKEGPMALYELRTYTLRVGAMAEAVKLYQEIGFPALQKGKHDKKLIGYFQVDTGTTTRFCICGSSTMMQIVGRIGPLYMRTRTSLRVSRQSFARC